ncbi:MAG: endonuclease domain-containing protein [Planctomycetes bacterium]|nr:endonuclease domain-containing protein [Planctomycetota bacterium]
MTIRPSKRPSEQTRSRVKQLRRNATQPEKILWSALRGRNIGGLKFRRQHPLEPYIVDFYCAEARLVIELDGESHNGREEHDFQRTKYLQEKGLTVFRITNDDVFDNLERVAEAILKAAFTKLGKPLP